MLEACDNWLGADNSYLFDAVEKTVQEGYFSFEDTKHAITAVKKSINKTALKEWAERADLSPENSAGGENVLCLHAGNLPLVGFMDVQWTHRLDDFEDMPHDEIIFAGSESSVPGVKNAIEKWNLAKNDTRFLIRTAHFSIAYLDRKDERSLHDLVEGIFRYGGKGCRSVAIVVAPYSLDAIKCELTDYIEAFWLENPQHEQPPPSLKQQFAYNKAVERPQAWLDSFLLQEGGLELDQDFVCYWVQGDEQTVAELAEKFRDDLQSVYVPHPDTGIPGWESRTEYLADAQHPPISWRPDGVDTLKWLVDKG